MFQPAASLTFEHARSALEAGLRAIADGQGDFDFSGVTVVDSSAVAAILAWQRAAERQARKLVLHHLPDNLCSLVALYDIQPLLNIAPARADLLHH